MAYIKTTISNYGDRASFATALKSFFINNELAPFELVSEDFTSDSPVFTVERNSLNLQFLIGGSGYPTSTEIKISTKNSNGDSVVINRNYMVHAENINNVNSNKALQILLIKNGDTVMLQIAPWNAVSVSQGVTIIDTVLNNGVNLVGVGSYSGGGTTISLKAVETQLAYIARPFHTGTNDETSLILSNQLAINQGNGVYFSDTTDLISAGGAKQFGYYITALNTYYGVLTDVCIPIGDKIEHIVNDTTE